jgi:hypothetical protein
MTKKECIAFYRMMVQMTDKLIGKAKPKGCVYPTRCHAVLDKGRFFNPRPFPKRFGEPLKNNLCFQNATDLAFSNARYLYCEGDCFLFGIPIHHAWNLDVATGKIVDITLGRDRAVLGYYGIVFDTEFVRKVIIANKYYGIIPQDCGRKINVLATGFPDDVTL